MNRNSHLGAFAGTGASSYGTGLLGNSKALDSGRNDVVGLNVQAVDWDQVNMQPLVKAVYAENIVVSNRNQEDINKWLSANEVTLEGKDIPRPIFEFKEANFPEQMEKLLYANYVRPTAIQSISWPVALSGRDIISIARTGSGKTLGFLLPGIMHTVAQSSREKDEGPAVLIVLPTRELAQQVEEVAREHCKAMNLGLTCLFGGVPKESQAIALRNGVDICVATPGRLLDFIQDCTTNMQRVSYLVLDEADRMLDMGFEPQIRKIVSQVRPDRQTLMFSATWPNEIRKLASDFQNGAVFLNVGSLELSANHNIEQIVEVLEESQKTDRLLQLLAEIGKQDQCKTIVFVETKRRADSLLYDLRKDGWPVKCIHGDKSQYERDFVLNEFREGKTLILLATDVASRGLDVSDIRFVINYDYPNNSEDYVHRIGRTARRDQRGTAFTFFNPENASKAKDLIKVLEEAKQTVPEELTRLANSGFGTYGNSSRFTTARRGDRSRQDKDYEAGGEGAFCSDPF